MRKPTSEEILEKLRNIQSTYWGQYQEWLENKRIVYRFYNDQHADENYKKRFPFDIFVPLTHLAVQTHASRLVSVKEVMRLRVFPRRKEDRPKIDMINEFLNYQAAKSNYNNEVMNVILDALIGGEGIGMVYWAEESKQIPYYNIYTGEEDIKEIPLYRGAKFIALKPHEVFWDVQAERPEDIEWVIRRVRYRISWMQEQNKKARNAGYPAIFRNIEKIKEMKRDKAWGVRTLGKVSSVMSGFSDWLNYMGVSEEEQTRIEDEDVIEVLEFWDLQEWRLYVIAPDDIVLRNTPIPYEHGLNPFVFLRFFPVPHTLQGKGSRPMEGLQKAINAFVNLMMEGAQLSVSPRIFVAAPTMRDEDVSNLWNKQVIRLQTDDVKRAIMLQSGDVGQTQNAILMLRELLEFYERGSFAAQLFQGVLSRDEKTATEISVAASAVDFITNFHLAAIEYDLTARVSQLFLELNKQYLQDDEVIHFISPVNADKEIRITKQDLFTDVDYYVKPLYYKQGGINPKVLFELWQATRENPRYKEERFFELLLESVGFHPPFDEFFDEEGKRTLADVLEKLRMLAEQQQLLTAAVMNSPQMLLAQKRAEVQQAIADMPTPEMPPQAPVEEESNVESGETSSTSE